MQKKCYFGCKVTGPLHSFPSPVYPHEDRFIQWKSVLSKDVTDRGDVYIHGNIRLCGRHFEPYYRTRGNRLTANSVPTLNLSFENTDPGPGPVPVPPIESDVSTSVAMPLTDIVATSTSMSTKDIDVTTSIMQPQLLSQAGTSATGAKLKVTSSCTKIKKSNQLSKLKVKLLKAQLKCKTFKQRIQKAERIVKSQSFLKVIEKLPEPSHLFMKMQQQFKKKPRGRRFSIDEKILALTLYKQSQKAYNLMSRLFVLPSKRSLQKLLTLLPLKPGINDSVIENLRKTAQKLPEEKKLCNLLFDEIALTPGLQYSQKDDQIIGLEDFGDHRTANFADHALVFMLKGIKGKYKQPICFTFCQSSTKKEKLKELIKKVVRQVNSTGLKIVSTICDQAGPNMSAINSLIKETKEKYARQNMEYKSLAFEIDEIKVYPLFDPPHLLKGMRNNLLEKDMRFVHNGVVKVAKWEHLKMLLEIDVGEDDIRLLNKLTESHIDKDKLPKMKVKHAAQVFSQRVSATLRFLARHNILPKECEGTADLILMMDKLFDSFNGHTYQDSAKPYKGCLKKNSIHHKLWDELLPVLRSMQFKTVIKKRDGSEETSYVQVPSIKNWIHNINVFKEMFKYLNEQHNVTNLLTRNFNQDPLENFFSSIRSNGVRNVSPTCSQFISAFKTLIINNFSSAHAVGANCEKDNNKLLQSLKHLLTTDTKTQTEQGTDILSQQVEISPLLDVLRDGANSSFVSEQSKRYVGGYIIKKCKKKITKNCNTCNADISKAPIKGSLTYERDFTKKSLNYPSDGLHKCLAEIFKITNKSLSSKPEGTKRQCIMMMAESICDFTFLNCKKHKRILITASINWAIAINIHSWCTSINRILSGKIKNFDRRDTLKLQAERYFMVHHKNKKK